jgi:hypothetical protein
MWYTEYMKQDEIKRVYEGGIKMNMYVWDSEAYADYGLGTIIVMAASVDSARDQVIEKVKADYGQDSDYYKSILKKVEEDISKEPNVVDEPIFIYGSS